MTVEEKNVKFKRKTEHKWIGITIWYSCKRKGKYFFKDWAGSFVCFTDKDIHEVTTPLSTKQYNS